MSQTNKPLVVRKVAVLGAGHFARNILNSLIVAAAILAQQPFLHQLLDQQTACRLVNGQGCRQLADADLRLLLHLLQYPQLRAGDAAAVLHLPEVLPDRAEQQAEFLQNGEGR